MFLCPFPSALAIFSEIKDESYGALIVARRLLRHALEGVGEMLLPIEGPFSFGPDFFVLCKKEGQLHGSIISVIETLCITRPLSYTGFKFFLIYCGWTWWFEEAFGDCNV